jgi:hypothetical protein
MKNKLHQPKGRSILTKQYVRSGVHLRSKDLNFLPDVNKTIIHHSLIINH